jgi:phosphatidylserine/phosphatidylglycerophosphate/cardiolipin synthase-like enzyme
MKTRILLFLTLFFITCRVSVYAEEETNSIIVTDNGLEMFQWDLAFVREAKQSIEISAVFLGGEIARELLTTIEKRLCEVPTLQVYILTAPILLEKEDWEIIEHLRTKYPHNFHLEHATTVAMIWPDITGIDNHIKMFIVDEKYFSTGGTNLDETQCSEGTCTPHKNMNKVPIFSQNLPAGMRDQDFVGKGPLAKELRKHFHKFYALWEHYSKTGHFEKDPEKFAHSNAYFPITEQASVPCFDQCERRRLLRPDQLKLIIGGPHQKQSAITQEYLRLIQQAKEELVIANLYFCPVDPIFKALLDAVNRGIKLTVLTNGVSDIAPEYTKFFCWANRLNYVPVLYGKTFHFWDAWSVARKPIKNTRIYEYYVKDILLHKKMMVVDGKHAIIGSYNLGHRSDIGDYEIIVSFDSETISNDLKNVFSKDLGFSREVSPEEARSWYFDPVKATIGEMQKRFHGLL